MNVFHRLLKSMGNLFTILRTSRLRLITWSKSNKSAISKTKEFYLRLRTLLSKMNASHMYLQGLNSSENFCNTKALIKIDDLFSSNFFKTMPEIYFNGKSQFLSYGDFSCGEQACGENARNTFQIFFEKMEHYLVCIELFNRLKIRKNKTKITLDKWQ